MVELALFLLLNGAVFGGAALVARHGLGLRGWLENLLGASLVGWVAIVVGLEALGRFGLIRLGPAACLASLVLIAGICFWRRGRGGEDVQQVAELAASSCGTTPARGLGAAGSFVEHASLVVAASLAAWAMIDILIGNLCSPVLPVSDAPIYHLYFAVRWWQSGVLELVPTPFGESAAPYFPANGDVWFTWLIVPLSSELLAKVGQWPFLPLAMASIYGLARQLDVRPAAAAFPAILWGTCTLPLLHSGFADVDLIMAAWILTGTWFLVRFKRAGCVADLVCCGLACGAALGTKYIAMLFVPWLVFPAAIFAWRAPQRWWKLATLSICVALPAAYWFARNAALTGNPLYPLHVELFGVPVFGGWYRRETLFTSQYHILVSDGRSLVNILLRGLDPLLLPVWCAGVCAAVAAVRRRRWLASLLVALACLHVVLFWFVNPYQTQDRFLFVAFALLAVPLAIVLNRWPLLAAPFVLILTTHLFVGPRGVVDFLKSVSTIDLTDPHRPPLLPAPISIGRLPARGSPLRPPFVAKFVLLGAVSLAGLAAWSAPRGRRPRVLVACLASGLIVAGAAFRANVSLSLLPAGPLRFVPYFPAVGYTNGWLVLNEMSRRPLRVAYAGTNLPFYLFGRGLTNQVRYVNINEHAEFCMHDYHALFASRGEPLARSATPDWDRRDADEHAWLDNLAAARIDVLFVGLTNRAGGTHNFYDFEGFPIERTWADSHPEIFTLLHADARTRIYAVRSAPRSAGSRSK